MDILLAHGYFIANDPHEQQVMKPYPPLGILYLSSYLKKAGFRVGVFDSTFATMQDFENTVQSERPSVVGLYVNMMTKQTILKMIAYLKSQNVTVIVGGPDPAYYAQEYLTHGVGIVVHGEGELTLAELLPHIQQYGLNQLDDIQGISYLRDDGTCQTNAPRPKITDLSAHPWADREAIDIERYMSVWKEHHGYSSVSVIHARGCPYTCTWCSHSVFGNTHRRRTPEDAAEELLWIKERYNPDRIWYADDVFAINHKWLREYANGLDKRGVKIPFECISRADRLNEEIIGILADMECFRLWNGSESGSQNVLDAMKRKVKVQDVQAKTHMLQKAGIETGMFIMLGYRGETVQDIEETVEHLKICNADIVLTTVAYPIKGTPYYAEVESDILRNGNWANNSDRDLTIAGRYSERFYEHATRWLVNEVALHRANTVHRVPRRRKIKMMINAKLGRLGMYLTQYDRDVQGEPLSSNTISIQDVT